MYTPKPTPAQPDTQTPATTSPGGMVTTENTALQPAVASAAGLPPGAAPTGGAGGPQAPGNGPTAAMQPRGGPNGGAAGQSGVVGFGLAPVTVSVFGQPNGIDCRKGYKREPGGAPEKLPPNSKQMWGAVKQVVTSLVQMADEHPNPDKDARFVMAGLHDLPQIEVGGSKGVKRSKAAFPHRTQPGIVVIDSDWDNVKDLGEEWGSLEGRVAALRAVLPWLVADVLVTPSASSYIVQADGTDSGLKGSHALFVAEDATTIPLLLEHAHRLCWAAGLGRVVVSKSGVLLERSPVDRAMKVPNQPAFVFGPRLEGMCESRRGEHLCRSMGATRMVDVDVAWLERELAVMGDRHRELVRAAKLDSGVRAEMMKVRAAYLEERKKAGVPADVVLAMWKKHDDGDGAIHIDLCEEWLLHAREGDEKWTVARLLELARKDPAKWHGLRLCDPMEPEYGGGAATLAVEGQRNGRVKVLSRAHGIDAVYHLEPGRAALEEEALLAESERERVLTALTERYAYNPKQERVYNRMDVGDFYRVEGFYRLPLALTKVMVPTKGGPQRVKAGKVWLDDPKLRPDFHVMDWLPDKPLGTIEGGLLNTWPGIAAAAWSKAGVVPNREVWWAFKRHVKVVCGGQQDYADLVLTLCAHALLFPLERPVWAWVIYSQLQGVGKSTVAAVMGQVVGKALWHAVRNKDISTDFVGKELIGKLIVEMGDVRVKTGHSRVETTEFIADIATGRIFAVNDKGISRFDTPNHMRMFVSMNKPLIQLQPDDRRYFVTDVELPDGIERAKYSQWVDSTFRGCWEGKDHAGLVGIYEGLITEYATHAASFQPGAAPPKTPTFYELCEDSTPVNALEASEIAELLVARLDAGEQVAYSNEDLKTALAHRGVSHAEQKTALLHVKQALRTWWKQHGGHHTSTMPQRIVGNARLTVLGKNLPVMPREDPSQTRLEPLATPDEIRDWQRATVAILNG